MVDLPNKAAENVPSEKPSIALGADHAGFRVKDAVKKHLEAGGYEVDDVGTWSEASADYPDFAIQVANRVAEGHNDLGVLTCGTGIGMSIAANKVGGVRAALAHNPETAALARQHNDANVLTFGARGITAEQAIAIVESFLAAKFEGGRHQRRIAKMTELDQERKYNG
jgi:ribose 5-phosphate isomerase B